MDPFIGGALVNAGSSLVSSIMGNNSISDANQSNIDLWKQQTEYNSPKNEMSRLKAAGINPHLYYSKGAGGGGASPAPRQEAQKGLDLSGFGNAVQTYLDLKRKDMDIEGKSYANRTDAVKAYVDEFGVGNTNVDRESVQHFPTLKKQKAEAELAEANIPKVVADTELTKTRIPNVLQQTSESKMRESLIELQKWLPAAESEQYQKYAIMPTDEVEMRVIKMIATQLGYKDNIVGLASKVPILGKIISQIQSKRGKTSVQNLSEKKKLSKNLHSDNETKFIRSILNDE